MTILFSLWTWLDGKKTNIGAVCLLIVMFISQVVIGIWHYNPSWLSMVSETLSWAGGILVPVGMGHQAMKTDSDTK